MKHANLASASSAGAPASSQAHSAQRNLPLLVIILGMMTALGPLSIDMYLPAFPQISSSLGAPLERVEFSLASFFIGLSLGQLLYGTITDRFGRKKPLYFGLSLYLVASLACAFATSIEMLIVLRFVQALGACSGMVIPRAMVRDLFDHKQSAHVFSLLMLVMGVAPILAPLLGGFVTQAMGWSALFFIVSAYSALCLGLVALFLPETRADNPAVRLSRTFHTYAAIVKDRRFLGYALAGGVASAGMFAYITGSPFVVIDLYGVPADRYGWVFGMNALGLIGLSQLNRRVLRFLGPDEILKRCFRSLIVFGLLVAVAGFFGGSLWTILLPLFFYIATLGMTNPNAMACALATQGESAGAASALIGTIQFVIAAISSSVVGSVHDGSARPMAFTIGVCGVLALLAYQTLVPRVSERR